jgi:hypothetical protein
MELRFELKTFDYDTMLNYHLFQKLKLIGRSKFNHLINTLTVNTSKKLTRIICLIKNYVIKKIK